MDGVQTQRTSIIDRGRVAGKARESVHVQVLEMKSRMGIEGNEKACLHKYTGA